MPRPGVTVKSRATAPPRTAPTSTGPWFVAGLTSKGPTDRAVQIKSMTDYTQVFGPRVTWGILYDALDAYFRKGGSEAWVSRVVGPAATVATVALPGAAAAPSLAADAIGAGASTLQAAVVAGDAPGSVRIQVFDTAVSAAVPVDESYDLLDVPGAVAWASKSDYIRLRALGAVLPALIGPTALAGGNDDRAAITDAQRIAAFGLFLRGYGPGQVSYPGSTTAAIQSALLDHAQANNRFAFLDGPDSSVAATVRAAATGLQAGEDPDGRITWGAIFDAWTVDPGVVRNTTRTIPPCASAAALVARGDNAGGPNVPAAGALGELTNTLALSQPEWSDADRESLMNAGVNTFRTLYGGIRLYGYRTLAPEGSQWISLASARLRMAITAEAEAIGEQFMFAQIDGRGLKVAEFGGALTGMLSGYYARGSLFGDTPADAFSVDVGAAVNTPETLQANELHAVLTIKPSPFSEAVTIEIVKVPITESL